ncbi:GAF domain-containing protein [Bradyrhizobium sp. UFLA03-84]|uniref:GAF domain-containing protein n=1 Tax=Bradyrhizobium sp. UFLA03-84 TaxID=418599 RepID=UPI000BAE604A|nr:GAF domain-containing protein [Bradyrhizobium sp. UFLA03-84]PAY10703.1 GAF domain-containing protein [Bradyrhizobium sp. UFLA03-84]
MMSQRALELFSEAADHVRSDFGPEKAYGLVESALSDLVSFKLLTILRVDGTLVRRMHSSDPAGYSVGGTKDVAADAWLRAMLDAGRPVVSGTPELVRERFPDHDAIFSLGCGAVLNVPVVGAGATLGSLNLLHEAGHFSREHALVARPFAMLLALAWIAE